MPYGEASAGKTIPIANNSESRNASSLVRRCMGRCTFPRYLASSFGSDVGRLKAR